MEASVNILLHIIEDDEELRQEIKDMLIENGISDMHFYSNHNEFLKQLNADINICVIDHYLPGTTGIEVAKEVKERNKFSYVIILTGQNNHNVTKQYINTKVDAYVDKNENDYKQQLLTELKAGFKEAKERVEFVKFLEHKYEQI